MAATLCVRPSSRTRPPMLGWFSGRRRLLTDCSPRFRMSAAVCARTPRQCARDVAFLDESVSGSVHFWASQVVRTTFPKIVMKLLLDNNTYFCAKAFQNVAPFSGRITSVLGARRPEFGVKAFRMSAAACARTPRECACARFRFGCSLRQRQHENVRERTAAISARKTITPSYRVRACVVRLL